MRFKFKLFLRDAIIVLVFLLAMVIQYQFIYNNYFSKSICFPCNATDFDCGYQRCRSLELLPAYTYITFLSVAEICILIFIKDRYFI